MPTWLHEARGPLGADQLSLRWYGTAAIAIRTRATTIFIDPYFTRDPLLRLIFGKAVPRPDEWPGDLPEPAAIFISHGHFDHLLDAPLLARRTGATLHASDLGVRIARAEGTPDAQLHGLRGGERIAVGDLEVEVIPGEHSRVATQLLYRGDLPADLRMPLWFLTYKCGPVFNFLIHWRGRTIMHTGSAQIREEYLRDRKVDVALVCLAGWTATPDLWPRLRDAVHPDVLVPIHHDNFFRPLAAGFREVPVAFSRMAFARIGQEMPETEIVQTDFSRELRLEAR